MAEEKKPDPPDCPKITIRKSNPKTEIWTLEYSEDCTKTGEFDSTVKKSGKDLCCTEPAPSPVENLVSF